MPNSTNNERLTSTIKAQGLLETNCWIPTESAGSLTHST